MSAEGAVTRRHFLTMATSVTGAVGLALTAAPFLASFKPSLRAQALGAPITVDISGLDEGKRCVSSGGVSPCGWCAGARPC